MQRAHHAAGPTHAHYALEHALPGEPTATGLRAGAPGAVGSSFNFACRRLPEKLIA